MGINFKKKKVNTEANYSRNIICVIFSKLMLRFFFLKLCVCCLFRNVLSKQNGNNHNSRVHELYKLVTGLNFQRTSWTLPQLFIIVHLFA